LTERIVSTEYSDLSRNVRVFLTIHELLLKLIVYVWTFETANSSTALHSISIVFVKGTFKSRLKTFLFCHAYKRQ